MYTQLVRPVLFRIDPERTHTMAIRTGSLLGKLPGIRNVMGGLFRYEHPMLETECAGIRFKNPVGLAAGFDKDANITDILYYVGFGFEEIGSVTGAPCTGNPKPRLYRLPKDKSLVVNYGLKSEGSEKVYQKLRNKPFKLPVGVSIAKVNKAGISTEEGIEDYLMAFRRLHGIGVYTTINVSCPNTSDGRTFCHAANLNALLKAIGECDIHKPLFLKMKPDFTPTEIDKTLSVIMRYPFITGLIISNLTKERDSLKTSPSELEGVQGSLSGVPIKEKSNRIIRYVYKKTKGKYAIIGCGGIFSAADAYEKIQLGASLVQLITGMIYEGPGVIKAINKGLVTLLERDGFTTIADAVGSRA